MNREIKFRVWDNLKREWLSNKLIWRLRTDNEGKSSIMPPVILFKQHPQGLTIVQYTGCIDSTGQEIFEGDIIRRHQTHMFQNPITVVRYERNAFWPEDITDSNNVSVIGNIFDDKGLIP